MIKKTCPKCNEYKDRYSKTCQKCYFNKRSHNIKDLKEQAIAKNYELLDNEYKGVLHKYSYKCVLGHIWKVTIGNFTKNECNVCRSIKQRNTIEDCHKLAEENDLIFKSTEYKNNKTKYLWECKTNKHVFYSKCNDIQQGYGCAKCYGNQNKTKQNKIA